MLILLLGIQSALSAKPDFADWILSQKPKPIPKFQPKTYPDKFLVSAQFANAPLDTSGLSKWLQNYNVSSITLIYTTYKLSPEFDQKSLNKIRIKNLFRLMPELENNFGLAWTLIEQTNCKDPEDGKNYFHGFLLQGTKRPDEAQKKREIAMLKNFENKLLNSETEVKTGKPDDKKNNTGKEPEKGTGKTSDKSSIPGFTCVDFPGGSVRLRSFIETHRQKPNVMNEYLHQGYITISAAVDEHGKILEPKIIPAEKQWDWAEKEALRIVNEMPRLEAAKKDGTEIASQIKISIYVGKEYKPASIQCDIPEGMLLVEEGIKKSVSSDSLVFEVLNRHKEWKDVIIVSDVTGSMVKHNMMVMAWIKNEYKSHPENIQGIVFFNDGDKTPDKMKKAGKTGGIYSSPSKDIREVFKLALTAMENGNGGDIRENNVEAILAGKKQFPNAKEIVMIADNPASPRDLEFVNSIGKPVHIILCGGMRNVNCDYLNLARATKGSIHMESGDYKDLHLVEEGESIEIGGSYFVMNSGRFIPV